MLAVSRNRLRIPFGDFYHPVNVVFFEGLQGVSSVFTRVSCSLGVFSG